MKRIGAFLILLSLTVVLLDNEMVYSVETDSGEIAVSEDVLSGKNKADETNAGKPVTSEEETISDDTIISENSTDSNPAGTVEITDISVSDNGAEEEAIEASGEMFEQGDLRVNGNDENIEDMPIKLQNGETYTINDFSEDYIIFIFGRGICGNTNTMTYVAESAYASGRSVKILMMDVDQEDEHVTSFQQSHPYTTVSYIPGSFTNQNWMWRMIEKYDLNNGDMSHVSLPCTVIFDQKHDLVFGTVGCKDEELTEFFKIVWIQSMKIDYDGVQFMHTGETKKLKAIIMPENATDRRLVWKSSNEEDVIVDENGTLTAVSEGASRITVEAVGYKPMYRKCSAFIDIYVDNSVIPATSLALDKSSCTVAVGKTVTLTPVFTPENVTYKGCSWKSDDSSVASVDSMGIVKGVSEGETIIRASHGIFEATCVVKVGNGGNENGEIGETIKTNKVVKEKIKLSELFGRSYKKYTVSPKEYATISDKKVITIKKPGVIVITAYTRNRNQWVKSAKAEINAQKPVFLQKTVETTKTGFYIDSNGLISGSTIKPDRWTSSNSNVATVDSLTGKVETVGKGTSKITAVYGSGKNAAKYSYTVRVKIPALNKTKANMVTGAALKLKIKNTTLTPTWSSSNEEIASIDQTGRISALNAGTVKVAANIEGVAYECQITVKAPKINRNQAGLRVGKSVKLTLKNTKLKNIHWKSSDEKVAYVDDTGMVYGLKPGICIISTDAGGVVNECLVTVD